MNKSFGYDRSAARSNRDIGTSYVGAKRDSEYPVSASRHSSFTFVARLDSTRLDSTSVKVLETQRVSRFSLFDRLAGYVKKTVYGENEQGAATLYEHTALPMNS